MADYVDANVVIPDINGWLNSLNNYAQAASNSAEGMADKLSTFQGTDYFPDTDFNYYVPNVTVVKPPKIETPDLRIGSRSKPGDLIIDVPLVDLGLGSTPEFTVTDPSINLPSTPDSLTVSAPTKEFTLDLDKTFPDAPDDTLPDVPLLIDLDLPDPVSLANPLFEGVLPDSSTIKVPGQTFYFNEDYYSSSLLDEIKIELSSRLTDSTGISPTVEAAIWNRERDREQAALLQTERTFLVERSSTGLTRPSGAAMAALDNIVQENQNKIIELSREIMIKQADLEQENFKFSVQQAVSLEDILMREHNNVQQRSFEVARYVQEIAIEIYKSLISKYNSEVEAYKAAAQVFEARISAELVKVEVYKSEIEAQKVKGEINEQNIRIYLARIEAINSTVNIYKTKVSAVSEELRAEGLKIDVYKTDVDAYSSLVSAKASEYSSYAEQIKGELAKVDIYDSQVKAFTSRLQGYSTSKDLEIKQAELKMEAEALRIKKYLADVEGFISEVRSDQLIYQSSADIYRGELQAYLADVNYNVSVSDIALKQADIIVDQNKFDASSAIERVKIRTTLINNENNGKIEGLKAAGNIYSQLSASSLSSMNISAGSSGQVSVGLSEKYSHTV